MKTKFDYYHMTPFYELNYFILLIVKCCNRMKRRKVQNN